MPIKDYRDLIVWQRAMDLVEKIYELTRRFPKEELYGLSSQVRKAAVSVPSNIAEGHGRHTTREFLHFLSIASGSLREIETDVLIARRLGYVDQRNESETLSLAAEVSRLGSALVRSLRKKEKPITP